MEAARELASRASVYLITQLPADSDELEARVLAELARAGLFEHGGCDRRKAMFCCTEDGRGAMCRQLAPAVHFDTSRKVLQYLLPHVPRVYHVGGGGGGGGGGADGGGSSATPTILTVESLAAYVVSGA